MFTFILNLSVLSLRFRKAEEALKDNAILIKQVYEDRRAALAMTSEEIHSYD